MLLRTLDIGDNGRRYAFEWAVDASGWPWFQWTATGTWRPAAFDGEPLGLPPAVRELARLELLA